jgi:post-segregation antitoxin (ccd killing protein)
VVVLAELPRTRETLLLRLLGKGRRLAEALADLRAQPEDAWERSLAMPLVLHFRLASRGNLDTGAEDDVSAEIRAWFKDYEQKLRAEGRADGRNEEAARALLTTLRVRGIAVSDAVRERILAEGDLERLERWLERAIVAASAAEVIGEPS